MWAQIVLRRCQTIVLPSYIYQENIISNNLKKRMFFSLSKVCLTLMCISFITRVFLILGYFFVSRSVALKDPKRDLESNDTQLLYQSGNSRDPVARCWQRGSSSFHTKKRQVVCICHINRHFQ